MKYYKNALITLFLLLVLSPSSFAQEKEWVYATRPGDTLWDISKKYLKNATYWSRLQKYNNVDIAKRLAPGTRLRAPLEWLKISAAPANIVSITGEAYYISAQSGQKTNLTNKQTLKIGDQITTGNSGSVLIQFADSSTLLVLRNSVVTFNTLSIFGQTGMVDTQLRLQKGRVETSVKPLRNSGSRFEITTPAAVAAVRGTRFRIAYEKNAKLMASEVVEGSVNVLAQNTGRDVGSGFGTITETGKPPQEPVKLLPPPDLTQLSKKLRKLPFTLNWPEVEKSVKYKIQIEPVSTPGAIILETTSPAPQYNLSAINDGEYLIKIRGIDINTLEGLNSSHTFTVNTHFPATSLIQPEANAELSTAPYDFTWKEIDTIEHYRFQLSTDIDFNNIVFEETADTNTIQLTDNLDSGKYFWRVLTLDKAGDIGQHSTAHSFEIEKSSFEYLLLILYFIPAFLL